MTSCPKKQRQEEAGKERGLLSPKIMSLGVGSSLFLKVIDELNNTIITK